MRFSSKQLTGMVLAGCAAVVMIPTAAVATGSSLVTIIGSGHQAHVSPAGKLATSATDALEADPYARFGRIGNNANDRFVIAGPTSATIALSSLTVSALGGDVGVRVRAVEPTDGSCAAGHVVIVRGEDMSFAVADGTTHSVEFPSPLIATAAKGKRICLIAHADTTFVAASSATITVSASGFLR
jgi:hypothetical protein